MSGGIITRKQILQRITNDQMITNIPQAHGGISSGDTICGYDVTLDTDFLSNGSSFTTIYPNGMGTKFFGSMRKKKSFSVGPGDILIAQTVEVFKMPLDLIGVGYQRAIYNNFGLTVSVPALLPGYMGKARFTLTNTSRNGIVITPGEGIFTMMFHTVSLADGEVGEAYTGKYNGLDQIAVIPPSGGS